jgi:hypothetical protein
MNLHRSAERLNSRNPGKKKKSLAMSQMKIQINQSKETIDGRTNSTNDILSRKHRPIMPPKKKFDDTEYGTPLINIKDNKVMESSQLDSNIQSRRDLRERDAKAKRSTISSPV